MNYLTDQEKFWAGTFGTEYINRNKSEKLLASNLKFFSRTLSNTLGIKSVLEFGANIGMNLRALKMLYPELDMYGIEINPAAAEGLAQVISSENIFTGSILEYQPTRKFDLVLIKGVLIHINPVQLSKVYQMLESTTSRYLLVAEYYNSTPIAIPYRGHKERLFKRDFAGEILDLYPLFSLIDYGFAYHKDPNFPQDDITWFLMEKKT